MISGVPGKAEAGVAGIVYNLAKELEGLGHSVKPMFFEDILPQQKWPTRFRTVEFAKKVSEFAESQKTEFDIVNIHAPFGFWYGAQRQKRGSTAGPPYVMTMHGLEERRNYAMGREARKGRADYFRFQLRKQYDRGIHDIGRDGERRPPGRALSARLSEWVAVPDSLSRVQLQWLTF